MATKKQKTSTGFSYEIDSKALNNFELLDMLGDLEDNPLLLPKIIKLFLGEEQKKALYDHVRDESGIVPTDKIEKELTEIFLNGKEIKN